MNLGKNFFHNREELFLVSLFCSTNCGNGCKLFIFVSIVLISFIIFRVKEYVQNYEVSNISFYCYFFLFSDVPLRALFLY